MRPSTLEGEWDTISNANGFATFWLHQAKLVLWKRLV
jgi:hypothetical protein